MSNFPPTWKFKRICKRRNRKKVLSIASIIEISSDPDECLSNIKKITKRDINTIARRTKLQANDEDWFHYRKGVITGTITYRISNSVKKCEISDQVNKAITKKYHTPLYYPSILWGRDNEELGIAAFIKMMRSKHHNLIVKRVGLQLDDTHHYIGASIDGLVQCSCCEPSILEVKCPYSIRDGTVAEDGKQLQYLTDDLQLKTNHQYYYQLQTYLGVYKYKKGYFCVYTPNDVLILPINFNETFWKKLKDDLCLYYEQGYLKTLFS